MGRNSVVGIATCYGLNGPGIDTCVGEIFLTRPDRPVGPYSFMDDRYRVITGDKAAGAWR